MQINLDTQGFAELSDGFADLKDKGDGDAVFSVGSNVWLEFGSLNMSQHMGTHKAVRVSPSQKAAV